MSRRLLLLGALPLPWFLAFLTLGGALAPGYRMVGQHASELLAVGGLPALAFRTGSVGAGLAFMAFGLGVGARSRHRLSLAALTWIVFGASMLSNAFWPMGHPMHGLYAAGLVNLLAPALTHLELPGLEGRLVPFTGVISLLGVLYLWMNLTGQDAPATHGLTQRFFFAAFAAWPFQVAWSLRTSGAPDA